MIDGDLFYSQSANWPAQILSDIRLSRILFIGDPGPELLLKANEMGIDCRQVEPERTTNIPKGSTIYRKSGTWSLIIATVGHSNRENISGDRQQYLEDSDPVIFLLERIENFWMEAKPIGSSAKFNIGDSVQLIAERSVGKIEKIKIVGGQALYDVLTNRGISRVSESDLDKLTYIPGDSTTFINQPISTAEDLALTLTATKIKDPLTDVIYSFQTSRTLFRPYQFKPVLKMLMGSSQRLLIADEVGLGKTIEAGLIWSELEFRTRVDTALVVCPASLKRKWQDEMQNRFDRKLEDLDSPRLDKWLTQLEQGRSEPLIAVVSLESLRSSVHLERMTMLSPRFDLVIVDEAHYLRNEQSKSYLLGNLLSDWADSLLFLSATPLNLGTNDLFNLLSILDPSQFFDSKIFEDQLEPNRYLNQIAKDIIKENIDTSELVKTLSKVAETALGSGISKKSDFKSLRKILENKTLTYKDIAQSKKHISELNTLASVFTRTRKLDTPENRAIREPIDLHVAWSSEEQAAYAKIYKWFYDRARIKGQIPGFILQMPLRQAASCLPAMYELMRDKYRFQEEDVEENDWDSVTDEQSVFVPDSDDFVLLKDLPQISKDTKYEVFESAIREAQDKGAAKQVLIFSFFRRTISYLEKRMKASGFKVEVMHGGKNAKERNEIIKRFKAGEFEILICSEVGSEGLDFQFCNTLVNYDLPWNPMKVEQRIGRLDRFGQLSEKIFIYNLRIPGTIEDDIFMRLYNRIKVFEESIGELEPILRNEFRKASTSLMLTLTETERKFETDRVGIAWQKKREDLNDLSNHKNLISGVDAFLIEGFDEHTPGRGRFLGMQEIIRVVSNYIGKKNGKVLKINEKHWKIIGSEEIAREIRSLINNKSFTGVSSSVSMSPSMLARELDGRETGLIVTFNAEVAANEGIELISVRHPLLECVKNELEVGDSLLSRFGAVALKGMDPGVSFLIGVHLARAHGLRPSLELWTTALDLKSGKFVDGPGDMLLQALAQGEFQECTINPKVNNIQDLVEEIENLVREKYVSKKQDLVADNLAIGSERARAKQFSLQNKVDAAKRTLDKVTTDNRDLRVVNMNKARYDRLKRELEDTQNLSQIQQAHLTVDAIAYAIVTG